MLACSIGLGIWALAPGREHSILPIQVHLIGPIGLRTPHAGLYPRVGSVPDTNAALPEVTPASVLNGGAEVLSQFRREIHACLPECTCPSGIAYTRLFPIKAFQ